MHTHTCTHTHMHTHTHVPTHTQAVVVEPFAVPKIMSRDKAESIIAKI